MPLTGKALDALCDKLFSTNNSGKRRLSIIPESKPKPQWEIPLQKLALQAVTTPDHPEFNFSDLIAFLQRIKDDNLYKDVLTALSAVLTVDEFNRIVRVFIENEARAFVDLKQGFLRGNSQCTRLLNNERENNPSSVLVDLCRQSLAPICTLISSKLNAVKKEKSQSNETRLYPFVWDDELCLALLSNLGEFYNALFLSDPLKLLHLTVHKNTQFISSIFADREGYKISAISGYLILRVINPIISDVVQGFIKAQPKEFEQALSSALNAIVTTPTQRMANYIIADEDKSCRDIVPGEEVKLWNTYIMKFLGLKQNDSSKLALKYQTRDFNWREMVKKLFLATASFQNVIDLTVLPVSPRINQLRGELTRMRWDSRIVECLNAQPMIVLASLLRSPLTDNCLIQGVRLQNQILVGYELKSSHPVPLLWQALVLSVYTFQEYLDSSKKPTEEPVANVSIDPALVAEVLRAAAGNNDYSLITLARSLSELHKQSLQRYADHLSPSFGCHYQSDSGKIMMMVAYQFVRASHSESSQLLKEVQESSHLSTFMKDILSCCLFLQPCFSSKNESEIKQCFSKAFKRDNHHQRFIFMLLQQYKQFYGRAAHPFEMGFNFSEEKLCSEFLREFNLGNVILRSRSSTLGIESSMSRHRSGSSGDPSFFAVGFLSPDVVTISSAPSPTSPTSSSESLKSRSLSPSSTSSE